MSLKKMYWLLKVSIGVLPNVTIIVLVSFGEPSAAFFWLMPNFQLFSDHFKHLVRVLDKVRIFWPPNSTEYVLFQYKKIKISLHSKSNNVSLDQCILAACQQTFLLWVLWLRAFFSISYHVISHCLEFIQSPHLSFLKSYKAKISEYPKIYYWDLFWCHGGYIEFFLI